LLFFDYPRCKHTRYFAEKLTLRVTANPQNKNFFLKPRGKPRGILSIKFPVSPSMSPVDERLCSEYNAE
jgi:hypothetical protein